jgi:hypothetical protein
MRTAMTKYDDVTIAIDRMIAKPCGLGEALNLLEQIKIPYTLASR